MRLNWPSETEHQRTTDIDNGKQACISILDNLLHVLADVTHPSWFGVQLEADRRPCIGRSVSQTPRWTGIWQGWEQL